MTMVIQVNPHNNQAQSLQNVAFYSGNNLHYEAILIILLHRRCFKLGQMLKILQGTSMIFQFSAMIL